MFRTIFFLTLLAVYPFTLFSQEDITSEQEKVFRENYSFIVANNMRVEGSKDEKAVFSFIEDFVVSRNLDYEYQELSGFEDSHSFSKNLVVTIPGVRKEQLIIAAAVDGPLESSGEMSSLALNPALALTFIDEWSEEIPELTLIFLFTSADHLERGYLGSSSFLINHSFKAESALLYLSLDENQSMPEIYGSTPGKNAPGWLMEDIKNSLVQAGLEYCIDSTALLINRAGLTTKELPISKFLEEDIPAAALISSNKSGPDIENVSAQYMDFLHNFINRYSQGYPDNWESNYLYIGFNQSHTFYFSEINLIYLYLLLISLALILPLFQQRSIYLNYKRFRHQLWTVPVMIYLSFIFFMISTLLIEEMMSLRSQTGIYLQYPFYFFLLKAITVLFLSSLFLNMLRGLPFPKNPHFYSYFAFVISFINLMAVSLFNITFTPIMLISLIFVFLFVISRGKTNKKTFMILSILPQFLVLVFLFSRDYTTVYDFSILSRIKGNWVLTFMTIPLICMISSLGFYHHHYDRSRQELKTALLTFFLALTTAIMVYFSFQLEPYSTRFRQQVILTDKMNMDTQIREVLLSSTDSIGSGLLRFNERTIPFDNVENEMRIQGDIDGLPLQVTVETDVFLDRRIIDLTITTEMDPEQIQLEIHSDTALVLYDCPFPYDIQPDLKSIQIHIGLNPPVPLNIPLIFSKDSSPDIHITALKGESSYKLDLDQEQIEVKSVTIIEKTIPFTNSTGDSIIGNI